MGDLIILGTKNRDRCWILYVSFWQATFQVCVLLQLRSPGSALQYWNRHKNKQTNRNKPNHEVVIQPVTREGAQKHRGFRVWGSLLLPRDDPTSVHLCLQHDANYSA